MTGIFWKYSKARKMKENLITFLFQFESNYLTNFLTLIINIEPSPLFQKSSISVMWRIDGAQNQLALEHIPPHFHDLCWWRFWSLLVREINGKSSNSKSVLIFFIWAFNRGVLFYFFGTRVSHCYFTRSNLKKIRPLWFCLASLLEIHRHPHLSTAVAHREKSPSILSFTNIFLLGSSASRNS